MNNSWPKVKLGEILAPVSRTEPVDLQKTYRILGAHWYAKGLYVKDTKSGSQIQAKNLYRVEHGDFVYNRLFAWKGSFAIASEQDHGCYVSNEFPCFLLDENRVVGRYLRWYFSREGIWEEALGLSTGGTPTSRNRLKEEKLLAMRIPLPPQEEQRRIVAKIDDLAAKIEEARALRQQATVEVKMLWSRGASKVIDCAVEKYPIRPLTDLVTIRGGGTPSKSDPSYWEGSIPWITPKDMKRRELSDAIDHISERATAETAAKLLEPGLVLVVVRGMILAHTFPSAVLRAPAAINQDMKALVPQKEVLAEFLSALFWANNSQILQLVEKSTHDTRKLETGRLLDTKIVVPPLPEQRRIVAELDALQAEVDALKCLQAEATAELGALLPSILDKAFKGEL